MKQEMDKSGLESTIFSAFAEASKRQYLYLCNMNTNVSRWSNSAVDCFELPGEYMINAAEIWENLIHPEDRKIYHEDILKVFSGEKDVHELEYRVRNKDGDYVVCSCYGKVVKGIDGKPDMFAGTITNHGIVDNIDPVTNLYNSSEFLRALSLVHEKKIPIVILMVGVNQFHNINSIYGYDNGDRVLKEFALGLKKIAGKQGAVYRMEGTKFALCIRDMDVLKTEKMYEQILEKKQCVQKKDMKINGRDLINIGMKPGKELGLVLDELFDMVIENPGLNTHEKLIELAHKKANPLI